MNEGKIPRAPSVLSKPAQALWRKFNKLYIYHDDQLLLLRTMLISWDRMESARTQIEEEGMTYYANGLKKEHPAIKIERESRAGFLMTARMLNIQIE